ncbi:MAG TPA: cytochrome c [Paraburkholderia sp.]|jgi:mono/diheme cytochrome c family protein|nr:cytochrome c [Paraburkholderia sp.]
MKGKIVIVAIVLAAAAGLSQAWEPSIDRVAAHAPAAADAAQIERGAHLAALGDCAVCHTAKGGKPFAGGLPLVTPFGTLYSTNITPDAQTGIGDWSLDAFTRAMRKGISRDGHHLYPAFPYPHFTHMTDADIAAIYAFMMSRDPVHASAPANRLVFPLNFRPLVSGWNLLYLHRGPEPGAPTGAEAEDTTNPMQTVEWQRGRYLVNGVGHCGACHTPLNRLGAEQRDATFAGGVIDGWDAPPLTTLLHAPTPWTRAQLVAYLRTGFASQHGAAAGPMLPVAQSLEDAPQSDVEAIATYLLSLQQTAPASPDVHSQPVNLTQLAAPAALANGATLFNAACASCHSAAAPMSTHGDRPSLALGTAVNADSPRNTVRMILDGIGWQHSEAAHFMPPFAQSFSDAQIADLANYTRARFSKRDPWPELDAAAVAKIRKESVEP